MSSNTEDPRRKPHGMQHMTSLKHVPSANSIIGLPKTLDKKLSEGISHMVGISKQKENDKLMNLERKSKQHTEEYEDKQRKHPDILNFKTLSKYTTGPNPTTEKRKEKKQKAEQKEVVRIGEAISINFNIQNMIHTKKSQVKNESERSTILNEEKKRERPDKKKKKLKTNEFGLDDFECEEILEVPLKSTRMLSNQQVDSRAKYQIKEAVGFKSVSCNQVKVGIHIRAQRGYDMEIKEFQAQEAMLNLTAQSEQLLFLSNRQAIYSPDPYYIEKRQKNFTWYMRAVLTEWMMHVNSEFLLKRDVSQNNMQTFHVSVVLADLYFTKCPNIQKGDLQLVGAASMYIAAKLEQQQPLSVNKFATSTNGKYAPNTILEMETKICRTLKWQLNPPTIYMWANRIMLQWDTYLEENQYAKMHPLLRQREPVFFKKNDERSSTNFRQVMQLIDCSILDIQSFQYKPKLLVCSFLYLVIGKQLNQFTLKKITHEFPSTSRYLVDEQSLFNDLYRDFVEFSFGFMLFDLLPTVQYCATYFILPMSFEGPAIRASVQDPRGTNIQDYNSFQTYNCHTLSSIRKRTRGI